MATVTGQDLAGLTALSREGTKLGKVKTVVGDDSGRQYVVVGRFLSHELVIPVAALEIQGDHVLVPHSSSYVDCAPTVKAKGAVSPEDARRLEEFYKTA